MQPISLIRSPVLATRPLPREPHRECPLLVKDEDGFREASAEEIIQRAQGLVSDLFCSQRPLLSLPDMQELLRIQLAPRYRSTFAALLLDRRFRFIDFVEIFHGGVDGVCMHTREVVRELLSRNAEVVILARNDTAQCTDVSAADVLVLRQLREALAYVDIRVLDYFVIGADVLSVAGATDFQSQALEAQGAMPARNKYPLSL